jgi:hypothetical protein
VTLANKSHRLVHHLVLEAFGPNRPPNSEARHLDDDRTNNQVANLRWGSRSENRRDAVRNGRNANARKRTCSRNHPLVEPNLVPSALIEGRRACMACQRALGAAWTARKTRGIELDVQAESDERFAKIMQKVVA